MGAAVTDLEGEAEETLLSVVVLTHLADSPAVRHSAGRGDFLLLDFLAAEITATLVTVVSGDAIATFAIVAFALLVGTLSISASMGSDIRIITRTTIPFTIHTPTMLINSADYRTSKSGDVTSAVQSALTKRGYYRGPIDGIIGAGSHRAIRAFQTDQGLPVTGLIDRKLISALQLG
jgi:hypothetical protein